MFRNFLGLFLWGSCLGEGKEAGKEWKQGERTSNWTLALEQAWALSEASYSRQLRPRIHLSSTWVMNE